MSEMSFGSLVRELSVTPTTTAVTAPKKTAEIKFSISLQSYPDIVITRETAKQRKHLILMPTQMMYYLKTESINGKEEPVNVELDAPKCAQFFKGCNMRIAQDWWMSRLPQNQKECEKLLDYLHDRKVCEMLKYHAAPVLDFDNMWGNMGRILCAYASFQTCPSVYKDYGQHERFRLFMQNNSTIVKIFTQNYGVSGLRHLIDTMMKSLVETDGWVYGYSNDDDSYNLPRRFNMDMQTAVDYICYESVQMGYADKMSNFFNEWRDCLHMQENLYGKVREKYPSDLPTLHHKLAYQTRIRREEIDSRMFEIRVKQTAKYEWEYGKYVFLAPTKPQDFKDEATQQANCLAGYVHKYAEGDCHIIFMRLKDSPDVSLVTIEISPIDLYLRQAYQRRNTDCTAEQKAAINEWIKHIQSEVK